jgi:hypothetical protein
MNVTQMTQAVVGAYQSKRPIMVWGAPGVGKSTGAFAASKILGEMYFPPKEVAKLPKKDQAEATFGYIDLRLSLREPSDLLGVMWPDVTKDEVRNFHASFLPRRGRGIICLDELPQATQLMQGAASQLVLDRRCGEYVLPDGWYVMACGNRMSDKAATNAMPTHIKNRFIHLYAEVDVTSWVAWALDSDIDVRVIAFIKFRSALLHQFDAQAKGEAFPTPRTWEYVSDLVKTWKGDSSLLEVMIKGTVGEAAGSQFVAFLRVADKLPSIDGILMNPKTAPIPDDMNVLYATVTALVGRASKDNLASVTAYFNRIADLGKPDFAMAAIKELTSRKDGAALAQTKAFIEFASKYSHLMS